MRLFIFILSITLSFTALGNIDQQRINFMAAEKALKTGNESTFKALKAKLTDYPLYIYLEYQSLKKRLPFLTDQKVKNFIQRYPDSPSANYLRRVWLKQLTKKGRWKSYLTFYNAADATISAQCYYHKALIKTGKKNQSFAQIDELWLSGKSRPNECNFAFKAWKASGKLTDKKIWQRIELAMKKGKTSLAIFLAKDLSKTDHRWVQHWIAVHNNPNSILHKQHFAKKHAKRAKILLHGLYRLSRKTPKKAIKAWAVLSKRYNFSTAQTQQAISIIAGAHIRHKLPNTLAYLDKLDFAKAAPKLQERSIRAALRQQDWKRIHRWISLLPQESKDKEVYRYWYARALEGIGKKQAAKAAYQSLALERSYHGYLAADQINAPYAFNNIPLVLDSVVLNKMKNSAPVRRMKELRHIGHFIQARREWYYLTRVLDNDEKKAFAKIIQSWGWHDRAIFTLAKTGYWDDLGLRFPLKYKDDVFKRAKQRNIEAAWVYAVMRQESAFASDARSPVGALGLMQLMPATARHVAKRLKIKRPHKKDLIKPTININLGTSYLREVLDELGQHPVLATAAYNAGPHRSRKWLPKSSMPADVWVELIPFTETRRYVQRVMTYTAIYQHLLGLESTRISDRMGRIHSKKSHAKLTKRLLAKRLSQQ